MRNLGLATNSVTILYDGISQLTNWTASGTGCAPRLNEQLAHAYDAGGESENAHQRRPNPNLYRRCSQFNNMPFSTINEALLNKAVIVVPVLGYGTIHRFSAPSNGTSHWNGSNIPENLIPNAILKEL